MFFGLIITMDPISQRPEICAGVQQAFMKFTHTLYRRLGLTQLLNKHRSAHTCLDPRRCLSAALRHGLLPKPDFLSLKKMLQKVWLPPGTPAQE